MSFALKELQRLVSEDTTVLGSVVGIDGVLIRVATARGAVTARTVDALVVGDRVLIQNGMASKAPVARLVFPV